ncbi:MAG TPA: hypothetical protein VIJ14_08220, partial [Rhabdochlamydiaceae bacterium]
GLEKEQAKIVTLDTILSALSDKDAKLESELKSVQAALEATQSAISTLGPTPTCNIDPTALETLKNNHVKATENHQLVKDSHKAEMESFEKSRPQVTVTPFDRSKIVTVENEIADIKSQVSALENKELQRCSETKSKITTLLSEISRLNSEEQTRQSEVKNKMQALASEVAKLESAEQTRQSNARQAISAKQVEIITTQALISAGDKALEAAKALALELEKVRSSICPTCEQGWVTETAKVKEQQILSQLAEHKKSIVTGNSAKAILDVLLNTEMAQLKLDSEPRAIPEIDGLIAQIAQLNIDAGPKKIPEIDNLNGQIAQLKLDSQPQVIPEAIELKLTIDFKNGILAGFRKEEQEHQFKENTKNQDILAAYAQKQTALRQTHESTISYVRDEEKKAQLAYESSRYEIQSFEQAKKVWFDSYNKLAEQNDKYVAQSLKQSEAIRVVKEEIELATEAKKAIKSYLSCSFEDALESIGNDATSLVRSIPNMATATLQFEGLKETKDGKVKEETNCILNMDGEIGIPVKSLSGGERSSIDIGIDLSVIKFIEERTGKGTDLFILDEFTNGLDTVCIENAIEMLRNSSVDRRILLIEHNPIAAQSIESRITVIRDGLTSKIVQQ